MYYDECMVSCGCVLGLICGVKTYVFRIVLFVFDLNAVWCLGFDLCSCVCELGGVCL